jgi:hypothetical protein
MKDLYFIILLILISYSGYSQKGINGFVCTEELKPLPFVNVYIPEKRMGTVTDSSGMYYLNINSKFSTDSVLFSYVGFQKVTKAINRLNNFDTIILIPLVKQLKTTEVVGHVIPASTIVSTAMNRIQENFSKKNRTYYAYYKEKLNEFNDKELLEGRCLEAAIKIDEPSYKKHYSNLKENACILGIRKSVDTIFHGILDINYFSFTLQQNIARYFGRYGFESVKNINKKWIIKTEEVYRVDSNELIYKISFSPVDTTFWSEKGYFWISSDNYKIYRFEINVTKGVYNKNTFSNIYNGYYNYVPYHIIVSYNDTPDGLALSYIKSYEGIEIRAKNMQIKSYYTVDCELKVVSENSIKLENIICNKINKREDIYTQKENSDPDFWKNFNIKR